MFNTTKSFVRKRDGVFQEMDFSKIQNRLKYLAQGYTSREERIGSTNKDKPVLQLESLKNINTAHITQKVIESVVNKIQTNKLDEVAARICSELSHTHPEYDEMASRIIISNHHKNTRTRNFLGMTEQLYLAIDKTNTRCPLINRNYYKFVEKNFERIQNTIDYFRDYKIKYFGFKTLERSYLLKIPQNPTPLERPQDLWMRTAITVGMNPNDHYCDKAWNHIKKTYDYISQGYYTHASPTLFNSGAKMQQLLSCFLLGSDDSLEGITKTLSDIAKISKRAGGIGFHFDWRSAGSLIRGTGGKSSGPVPFLQIHDKVLVAFNQGGCRQGSGAAYMSIDHPDIEQFIECRNHHKKAEDITPDLFLAIAMRDLFMKRVVNNEDWSLFDPDECPGLLNSHSQEYEQLYLKYEKAGKARKTINARKLLEHIAKCRLESGLPYIWNQDMSNRKSNQKNLGVIRSSNLCVTPDTLVLTDKGHIPIQELYEYQRRNIDNLNDFNEPKVNVWNGVEFSEVEVKKTGENQEIMRISFSDGMELKCTPYHKFYIQTKKNRNKKIDPIKHCSVDTVEAKELKEGMKLIKCNYPVIEYKEELRHAYTQGIFCGDGHYENYRKEKEKCTYKALPNKAYCKRHIGYQLENEVNEKCQGTIGNQPVVLLYGEKIKLLKYLSYINKTKQRSDHLYVPLTIQLKDKFLVPLDYSIKSKMDWLSGLVDTDGQVKDGIGLIITSIHKKFLINIKYMLQLCGVNAKISKVHDELTRQYPDGKTKTAKELWAIDIDSESVQKLLTLGFAPKRLQLQECKSKGDASKFVQITKIEKLEEKSDTYCFNEEKRHVGIFNGVISMNCNEIVEYSSSSEYACCTLASLCLPKYVKSGEFNFKKLAEVARLVFRNLNRIIDINDYPCPETKISNLRHRPLGLGVQGLADLYHVFKLAYDSKEARELNKKIFETIYYATMTESCELAREKYFEYKKQIKDNGFADIIIGYKFGRKNNKPIVLNVIEKCTSLDNLKTTIGAYSSFEGSPISQGKFQFDLVDEELEYLIKQNPEFAKYNEKVKLSGLWDWETLRTKIKKFGVRNSLCVALMPTASTAQIMGNSEAFEPITSNIYRRDVLAGQFTCVNKYLINELIKLGIWNTDLEKNIIANNGSIQYIDGLPADMKERYKTVWELSQRAIIDQVADRAPFVDQSQSMNLYLSKKKKNIASVTSMDRYTWFKRLKTACYYLRTQDINDPQKFSIVPDKAKLGNYNKEYKRKLESIPIINEKDVCLSCSG